MGARGLRALCWAHACESMQERALRTRRRSGARGLAHMGSATPRWAIACAAYHRHALRAVTTPHTAQKVSKEIHVAPRQQTKRKPVPPVCPAFLRPCCCCLRGVRMLRLSQLPYSSVRTPHRIYHPLRVSGRGSPLGPRRSPHSGDRSVSPLCSLARSTRHFSLASCDLEPTVAYTRRLTVE